MTSKKNPSIRQRLLVGLLAIITIACLLTLTKNYFDTRHEIQELFDAQLAQSARVLLELSTHELYEQLGFLSHEAEDESDISEHIHTQVHKYQQEIDFQVWAANGHLAVRSENSPTELLTATDNVFGEKIVNGERWRVYSVSNADNTIRVQVGQPFSRRDDLSDSISVRLITTFILLLPLLAILIYFTVGRIMNPLRVIATEIENRRFDNLQSVDTHNVPAEALPMVKALNALFFRLRNAFEDIILFTSNAAHELRTPLAAQKVHAQVALKAGTDEQRREALTEIVENVNKATNLVQQLLTLARLDPEHTLNSHDNADLCSLTHETLSDMYPAAFAKNIDVSYDGDQNCRVWGESSMIGILVRNLIENAIRYTPNSGKVLVKVMRINASITLEVADSGPGIEEAEYEKVFKRFYRVHGNTQHGTGLGLAMVHRIVQIHNAEIEMGRSEFGGLSVRVRFKAIDAT